MINNKKKVIILGFTGIGNVLMFVPTLICIKKELQDADITFLSYNKNLSELLLRNELIKKCVIFNDPYKYKNKLLTYLIRLVNLLKLLTHRFGNRYDISFVPYANSSNYQALLSISLGAKLRIIHTNVRLNSYLKKHIQLLPYSHDSHDVEQNLLFFPFYQNKQVIFPRSKMSQIFRQKQNLDAETEVMLATPKDSIKVVVHPKCKFNDSFGARDWGLDRFVDLFNILNEKLQSKPKFILIGAKSDFPDLKKIKDATHANAEVLVNRSFDDLLSIFSRSDIFIGVDSSMGHLAAFTKIKIFSILGPTDPLQITPYSENAYGIRHPISCSPCYLSYYHFNCPNRRCLTELSPNEVATEVLNRL